MAASSTFHKLLSCVPAFAGQHQPFTQAINPIAVLHLTKLCFTRLQHGQLYTRQIQSNNLQRGEYAIVLPSEERIGAGQRQARAEQWIIA